MLNIINYPATGSIEDLVRRPVQDDESTMRSIRTVLDDVKKTGDKAVKKYTRLFDKTEPESLSASAEEWAAADNVPPDLKLAIEKAFDNIYAFHSSQRAGVSKVETMDGVLCWRKQVPITKVGLYIPGGTAPLFSTLLMLGIPAIIAGCREIIVCTPPGADGFIDPVIMYVAKRIGLTNVFKIGGAQAIAAMAYGTETVPQVYKIFGPGNRFVTAAKNLLQTEDMAIDLPAGPSEVAIIADATADPEFVAADLLAQAEHGPDSQVLLVCTSMELATEVKACVEDRLRTLPRRDIIRQALNNSKIVFVKSLATGMQVINSYAPEHLIINTEDPLTIAEQVENAGSVFIGNFSPESVGDYASGTNHTLPTNGAAKAYSGVCLDSFMKNITYQQLSNTGLRNIGPGVVSMALAEGLQAHAEAVTVRLEKITVKNETYGYQ